MPQERGYHDRRKQFNDGNAKRREFFLEVVPLGVAVGGFLELGPAFAKWPTLGTVTFNGKIVGYISRAVLALRLQ